MSRDTKRLAQKADYLQSVAVRLRDTDSTLYGPCCTCGKTIHAALAHAGHFVPRRHNGTRYDPRNVNMQCADCNVRLRESADVHVAYLRFMLAQYGGSVVDALGVLKREAHKLQIEELRRVCAMYMAMIDELAPTKDESIRLSERML